MDDEHFVKRTQHRDGVWSWERVDLYPGEPWSQRVTDSEYLLAFQEMEADEIRLIQYNPYFTFLHVGSA